MLMRNRIAGAAMLAALGLAPGAAMPADRTIDGRDALPTAASRARSPHEALFWSSQGQLAVRRGKWKLVKDGFLATGGPDGNKKLEGDDALFLSNLEEDPGESRNRRHEQPAMADELASMAHHWLEEVSKM